MAATHTATDEPDVEAADRAGRQLAPPPTRQAGVDRFDEAIVVTRTRAWIGLAACLALVLGVVAWAIVTKVDRTVKAPGIVLTNGTLTPVLSPETGTIVSMPVQRYDIVEPQQVIAEIAITGDERLPILAPLGGEVIGLPERVGATLREGELVATLAALEGPVLVTMFLPPGDAQQVEVGTEARVALAQGGTLDGEVTGLGTVPVTAEGVADAIGSQSLAPVIAPNGGIEVVVTIAADEDTSELSGADVAEVTLIVGTQRPIEYVF
jgi:multidrug efflux pump subunit AcrA (membrane-fusion protein)